MSDSESHSAPRHAVAVIGGATAGAEAAGILAARGISCAVFEQNRRPYGKIEDGLPRWHVKLRRKEFESINGKLEHPLVHFVPSTKVGTDVDLRELVDQWGFSAVILANGAWRDRPFPVADADTFLGHGLVYQNSFIYWFNHFLEPDYAGPHYEIADGTIVVGGGLASIDVVKALQIEATRRALEARGFAEDALAIEHAGIARTLAQRDLSWPDLGLRGAALYYRRRVEDMPLADGGAALDDDKRAKVEATRRKILDKAREKYCFDVMPLRLPVAILADGERLAGVRFQHTRVVDGRAVPVDGEVTEVAAPMVVSSIGSIPEPIAGVELDGHLYRFADRELGRLEGFDGVFGTGNVVTGKGNIKVSRKHSTKVTSHVIESFLGLGDGEHGEEGALLDGTTSEARRTGENVAGWVAGRPALAKTAMSSLLERIRTRQRQVGYDCGYREWIARVSPAELL